MADTDSIVFLLHLLHFGAPTSLRPLGLCRRVCNLVFPKVYLKRDGVRLNRFGIQRERLLEYGASHIQHMQKALTEMNVQLHHVVTDITGVTGLRIIRAILAGERNPTVLARMRDRRCHAIPAAGVDSGGATVTLTV